MSDQWEFFPCTMGENQAFISTDIGVADQLSRESAAKLLKVCLKYKAPSDNGLPTNDEFEPVSAIEDQIQAYAESRGDLYVGRVTVAGQRHFFVYVQDWSGYPEKLTDIGGNRGYELKHAEIDDPGHSQYWDYLWPTDSDWRIINDMKVLQALEKNGDDHSLPRPVDHWIYFDDLQAAIAYKDWAVEFGLEEVCPVQADESGHLVRLKHIGTMHLNDLSRITLALAQKAMEAGGNYDGWETQVMRPNDPASSAQESAL